MQLSAWEWVVTEAAKARDAALSEESRRERGVVHTPVELAHASIRRLDDALRSRLGLRAGLADPRVVVLDPGSGPGVFLAVTLAVIAGRASRPRALVGFELDAGAAEASRASLGPIAAGAGVPFRVEATNALALPPAEVIAGHGDAIVVVIGNPPWAGRTANRDAIVTEALLEDFRRDAKGERLRERKIGVLSDDYVRFVRWSCEMVRIAPAGGAIALFTNASFLDGPVHRAMRGAMRAWLDEIDVVDFGGSSLVARDRAIDDNVFGVRPSVAWTLGLRRGWGVAPREGVVNYVRLRGERDAKMRAFAEGASGELLALASAGDVWKPRVAGSVFPDTFIPIDALFPFHREGIQTNRDDVAIAVDAETLLDRLRAFARGEARDDLAAAHRARTHYDVETARARVAEALASGGSSPAWLARVAYRPFDDRFVAAIPGFCHRLRPELQAAVARSSFCLLTVAKDRGERPWAHAAVSRFAPDNCYFSSRSSCRTRAFPTHHPDGTPNLDHERLRTVAAPSARVASVESWMAYALAVLSSATYRVRYDAALRRGFPAIPPPPDDATFTAVARAGGVLLEGWLSAPGSDEPIVVGHREARGAFGAALDACEAAVVALLPPATD